MRKAANAVTIPSMNDYDDLPEEENDDYDDDDLLLPRGLPLADEDFVAALDDSDSIDLGELDLTGDESLDIEAALESVASLSDVIAEQEAQEAAEQAQIEEQERQQREAEAKRAAYYLPRPPLTSLERGQLSSVIPAILLMIVGAGLTLALTAEDFSLEPGTLVLVAMGGISALMLAQWVSSARWAGGALFGGLSLLFTIVITVFLQSDGADGWPLFISGIGASALLSAFLAQPLNRKQPFLGVMLVIAGGLGYALNQGLIDFDFTDIAPILGVGVAAFIVILLIMPVFIRSQD